MSNEERPALDVSNMFRQVIEQQQICSLTTKPMTAKPSSTMSDEDFAKLMAPCTGPNDDPTKGDLH